MTARVRWFAISMACLLIASGRTLADDAPKPDLKPFEGEVRKLVEKYYPKGKVTLKDETITIEFNTRKYMVHEPTLTGEWQDAWEDIGPQKGGIHGTIGLRKGKYGGQAAVPQSIDKRYFILWVGAPYSETLDSHLYIHLKYPGNVSKKFLEEFGQLVNEFDKHIPAKGK